MSGMNKAERLNEMKRLYMQRAYSDIQLAERLDVSRETVFRDRVALTDEEYYPIEKNDDGLYYMNRSKLLSEIKVSLHEALVLYLSARKTSRQTYFRHTHAISAMEKLTAILYPPMAEKLLRATDTALKQEENPQRIKIIENITQAWAEQREVRIEYQALGRSEIVKHTLRPYLVEPSIWSDSVYVIAYSDKMKTVIPFKIERIRHTFLSGATFELPDDFDEETLLKHAWGIWYQDKDPVTVKLHFNKKAAQRVKESKWHPLEKVEDTEDGGCIWQADLSEWKEMLPWIRGWGADCEVISPPSLQKTLRKETKKLMNLYLGETPTMPPHYQLWAKAQRKDDQFHPLIYHLIDVGACAKTLWETSLSEGFKKRIAKILPDDFTEEEIGSLLAFLAATHDIGKASPSFQQKHAPAIERIKKAGFEIPVPHGQKPTPHGTVSAWALTDSFQKLFSMEKFNARRLANTLGGHHGIIPVTSAVNRLSPFDKGNEKWDAARLKLIEEIKSVFMPPENFKLPEDVEEQNMLLMLLLGLTTTADWLGSDENFFDYEDRFFQPKDYALLAKEKAKNALATTGWQDNWQASGETVDFSTIFPFAPREIQAKVIEAAKDLPFPSLTILEAPTGIGKTEAALYLADTWLQKEKGRGLYIAMPTQATSNQIFERTVNFLGSRYPGESINIHLAHGQAEWNEIMQRLTSISEGPDDTESKMQAEAWFDRRKRTLLAPFGVGTVDQALMGILQSRHFYLRLFGLANKVVIFDEVHAYDTYMSQLFLRLLSWLRAVGSSVIVLSATLPEETRVAMTKTFAAHTPNGSHQAQYPRLTLVTSAVQKIIPLPAPADRTIRLQKIPQDSQSIIAALEEKLAQGGCAAVICNTVSRAQEIYAALQQADFIVADQLTLFHSRFPPAWRKNIEEKVLAQFGKGNGRPEKAIVVATQVIEQSLDLDFDLMVSDLAPVDLLIQRIGRLHRHKRDARPLGLAAPQLLIAQPEGAANAPQFGSSEYIYPRYILWQTWLAIQDRDELHLPSETTDLIEGVYGAFDAQNHPAEIAAQLENARNKMRKDYDKDNYTAMSNLIALPNDEDLMTSPMQDLKDDEDPSIHQQLKAVTRLIPPGVNLVCLHKTDDGSLNTEPDGSGETIDFSKVPDKETVKELLLHSVALHRQDVVRLLTEKTHPKWQRKTALRYHIPLIFEQNRCPLDGADLILTLSKELGLQVKKEAL